MYKIIWDSGYACGEFALRFLTKDEAKKFGEEWKHSMIDDPESLHENYSYEIVEDTDGS